MILEGIVTTFNDQREVNVAAMGPIIGEGMQTLLLRPYQSTATYQNLKVHPQGVFHIVDNVELLVRAALNLLESAPDVFPAERIAGAVLGGCCRWYEFEVRELDDRQERTEIQVEIVHTGKRHDFLGFNRAKHAVIEYAILASRLFMLTEEEVLPQYQQFQTILEKTGGPQEFRAFELVTRYVIQQWPQFQQTLDSLS
ncbi:MAG: DUF447 family protein [Planctomycetaceae bacterium]|nr:DUF447 family protein [Planctomycetaceae bacterium]